MFYFLFVHDNFTGACKFQNGFCTWYNLPKSTKQDDFDWIVGSGLTPSRFTGPKADHNGDTKGIIIYFTEVFYIFSLDCFDRPLFSKLSTTQHEMS